MHSSNSFVNRGIGLNGEPLPQHGYHRDSMKGTVKLRGASRAIQNCPLDSGALAALALATGLGSDAVEAAVSYDSGRTMLVVAATLLSEPPLFHANLSVAKMNGQPCRTLSHTNNLAPSDSLCSVRQANLPSAQVCIRVGGLHALRLC